MAKPFGKPVHHGRGLTKGLRLTMALWGAAIPAYFLCRGPATKSYPTLSESPFFWPSAWIFILFYAFALSFWFRRRPTPRAPGSGKPVGRIIGTFLLALLIAFPTGLISAALYEPAFKLANGIGSGSACTVEHALVAKADSGWVLDSPYWRGDFQWKILDADALPKDLTSGSLAKITLRRGLLGAKWIESVEYTVLK